MQIPEGAAWIGAQMETLFYFCLRKTSSADEAAELSQDIALAALDALHRGAKIDHMPGWFWQIARNRYARWAERRHKIRDTAAESDITAYEIAESDGDLSDAMVRAEELSILRRELAFVRREYREILVAYYLENRPIRDIASSLSLSVNAVQQRLSRARKTVKEGMDMAREFGVRSYQPENVNFTMNGRVGKKGQPWTILTHLLYKNIFLELSGNPETAEEVSIALGIALPYMEDELSFLVREQLLKKSGDRYETDFPIVSREEQRAVHEKSLAVAGPLTDTLCAIVDTYAANGGAKARFAEIGYENAKWALLARVFDELECAEYAKIQTDRTTAHGRSPDTRSSIGRNRILSGCTAGSHTRKRRLSSSGSTNSSGRICGTTRRRSSPFRKRRHCGTPPPDTRTNATRQCWNS